MNTRELVERGLEHSGARPRSPGGRGHVRKRREGFRMPTLRFGVLPLTGVLSRGSFGPSEGARALVSPRFRAFESRRGDRREGLHRIGSDRVRARLNRGTFRKGKGALVGRQTIGDDAIKLSGVHSGRGCGWGPVISCPSGERGMGPPTALRLPPPVLKLPPLLGVVAPLLQRARRYLTYDTRRASA